MDIGKAFSFVFEDEEWVSKILIGGLIGLIPLVGQLAVMGYALKVAQNVAQGNPRPLPRWSEFGDHLMRGLYDLVIRLVYSLPILVIALLFACVGGLAGGGASSQRAQERVGALFGLLGICLVPIMLVLGFAIAIVAYAALGRFVATNNLGAALRIGEVVGMVRKSIGAWAMMLVVAILASFVGGLGAIACGVGALFTGFYAQCVIGHALGQTVVQQGMAAEPAPVSYGPPPTYQ
ncbi:hypothetical protein SE17_33435 [Kouleothrix aurantiaca]|uniref:DUF4013 domain-containing protein n=1 Tax=Kouleothrix aurantiaca TaxID=186479 RepID=A0A0N8PR95_9CHLR|nr:hypothetical protein SE17_33435 [Kouleothrix aurantiaca]